MPPTKQKIPYEEAYDIATELQRKLYRIYKNVQIAGSLRRQKPTIGDIDIVVSGPTAKAASLLDVTSRGKQEIYGYYKNMHVNIYTAQRKYWGAMVMFLTGPNKWNIGMRIRAKRMGMKLSQYGVFVRPEVWSIIEESLKMDMSPPEVVMMVQHEGWDLFNELTLTLFLKHRREILRGHPIAARTEGSIFKALQKPYKSPMQRGV